VCSAVGSWGRGGEARVGVLLCRDSEASFHYNLH
jgi:hypothetical protein